MKKEIQRLDNVAGNYNPEKDFDNVLIKFRKLQEKAEYFRDRLFYRNYVE